MLWAKFSWQSLDVHVDVCKTCATYLNVPDKVRSITAVVFPNGSGFCQQDNVPYHMLFGTGTS